MYILKDCNHVNKITCTSECGGGGRQEAKAKKKKKKKK